METESITPTQDKQITVDVPEDRVPEFYAWYARFLAGSRRGRGGPRGRRGRHRHGPCGHGHGPHEHHGEHGYCDEHSHAHEDDAAEATPQGQAPAGA